MPPLLAANAKLPNVEAVLKTKLGKYFVEIDTDYITDKFNLTGLPQEFADFEETWRVLVSDRPFASGGNVGLNDLLSLYGLIHARFIMTSAGVHKMKRKIFAGEYGCCLRYFCRRQFLIPAALSCVFGEEGAVLYCPNCEDVYAVDGAFGYLDGAFFGPSFAAFFVLSYPESFLSMQQDATKSLVYTPKIFGFRLYAEKNAPSHAISAV